MILRPAGEMVSEQMTENHKTADDNVKENIADQKTDHEITHVLSPRFPYFQKEENEACLFHFPLIRYDPCRRKAWP